MKRGVSITIIVVMLLVTTLYIKNKDDSISVTVEQTLQGVSVCLDPGHGGLDNGASWGGVKEDELNLKISYALKEELESRGATVYMTREDDQDMTKRSHNYSKQDDMYLRVQQIDQYDANYLLSIHLNASPASSAWGSQVFYFNRSENGKILANDIHESMKAITGTRKKISGADFHVLRATQTVGVLIECGFISNGNERGQLSNSSYHKKLAISIVDGLQNFHQTTGEQLIKDKEKAAEEEIKEELEEVLD
ncbi:MAG: N-acetylmuramoyl-L-alanine amidase [Coprobacillaceae bacterium]